MGKKRFSDLRRLYKIKKYSDGGGCVAFAYCGDNKGYYADNGTATQKQSLYLAEVEDILGKNLEYCGYDYAYSVLQPVYPDSANSFIKPFYERLYLLNHSTLDFLLSPSAVRNVPHKPRDYTERYFTCAEKKILGYVKYQSKTSVSKIYSTKRPCFHCLPEIQSVYYLEENKEIRHIQKISGCITPGIESIRFLFED